MATFSKTTALSSTKNKKNVSEQDMRIPQKFSLLKKYSDVNISNS